MKQLEGYVFTNQEGTLAWDERIGKWSDIEQAVVYTEEAAQEIIARQKNEFYVPHEGDFELITKTKPVRVRVYIFTEMVKECD